MIDVSRESTSRESRSWQRRKWPKLEQSGLVFLSLGALHHLQKYRLKIHRFFKQFETLSLK
jgi:hypothetical protein